MEELRQRYAQSLPQKGRDIARQWQACDAAPQDRRALVELHQQVHRLSGSAPAYGFDELGALAQPIDAAIAEWLARNAEGREQAELLRLIEPRVRALVTALAF
jgi:HPt (histidine-containing phosphotransfer) domain-containing protein